MKRGRWLLIMSLLPAFPAGAQMTHRNPVHVQPRHEALQHEPPSHESAADRATAAQKLKQAEQDKTAREAAAAAASREQKEAETRADALAQQRVEAATGLRRIEGAVLDSSERLRDAAMEQQRTEATLKQHEEDFSRLLPMVLRMSRYPAETLLAVPAPPAQALEGLLVARGLATQLNQEAAALRQAQADAARSRQEVAERERHLGSERLRQLAAAAALDRQLDAAKAQAAKAGDAQKQEAVAAAGLAAQAKSLRDALAAMDAAEARAREKESQEEKLAAASDALALKNAVGAKGSGGMVVPVAGHVLRAWGANAEDGPATGITYSTAPGAYVASPCAGHVAFAAPFRSYGQLLILECRGGYDFVLAGLSRLDAVVGRTVKAGEPVGRMAGVDASSRATDRPSLYVELRQNGQPVNPAPFLNTKG